MNNEQATKDTNPADPDYQDWLTYCKAIATDAKFRGLLKAYFTGHPSEDYAALAVGAQEILSHLMLIRLFQQTPIYSAQPLLDGLERFAPPRISLYDVGLRPVPRPSKVWNAAMGCLRRLWRKTNSSR